MMRDRVVYVISPCVFTQAGVSAMLASTVLPPVRVVMLSGDETIAALGHQYRTSPPDRVIVIMPPGMMLMLRLQGLLLLVALIRLSRGKVKALVLGHVPAQWLSHTLYRQRQQDQRSGEVWLANPSRSLKALGDLVRGNLRRAERVQWLGDEQEGNVSAGLTYRELQAVIQYLQGMPVSRMAEELGVGVHTVHNYRWFGMSKIRCALREEPRLLALLPREKGKYTRRNLRGRVL